MVIDDVGLDTYLFRREERAREGRDIVIAARDGAPLSATLFRGGGPAVVVASATGVRRRFYAPFAQWLAARGFDVLTFDYRGIGGSRDYRGGAPPPQTPETRLRTHRASRSAFVDATMRDWGERDLAGALDAMAREYGTAALVGHSVGGQLPALLPDPSVVSAIVTIGAQSGDFRLWPMPQRLAMAAIWYGVVPGVTRAIGYLPGALGVGEDLPAGVALEWARWCRTPGYFARSSGFARFHVPLLALGIESDPYAPRVAVDALVSLYSNARVTRRELAYPRLGHFGFFRERNEELWPEVSSFLVERLR
jgi:predicted alpha/beta hydrolase